MPENRITHDLSRIVDAIPRAAPLQHQNGVYSAVFSPDGRRVVTASSDNTARLWKLLLHCCESSREAEANLIRLEKKQTKSKRARVAPLYNDLRAWFEHAFNTRARTARSSCHGRGQGIREFKDVLEQGARASRRPRSSAAPSASHGCQEHDQRWHP